MRQNMISYPATKHEVMLVEDIEEVGFGELYNIRYDKNERPTQMIEVSEKTRLFLKFIRNLGEANRLIVHDSEPSILEYRTKTKNGNKCLKKMKF